MGSSDENSGDEQSQKVTLQIKVKDGSLKQVQTRLDATIEEFRLLVAEQTGVPPDQQNLVCEGHMLKDPLELRSYNLEPGQIINLGILGSSCNTDTPHSATFEQNEPYDRVRAAYNLCILASSSNTSQTIHINYVFLVRKFTTHPGLAKMLDSPIRQQYIFLFLVYVEIYARMANIEESGRLKSVSFGHYSNISLAAVLHKLSHSFYHMILVGSSRSANKSRSNSAPNSDPLPNPWASSSYIGSSSSVEQASISDEKISKWQKDCSEVVDKLMPVLTSDSTLFRNCKEKGKFIDRAYAVISDPKSSNDDQYTALDCLAQEVCNYFSPIETSLRDLHDGMDSDSSCLSCGGGDECSANNVAVINWLVSELAQMEHMGFMDGRQNFLALIFSRCKLDDAIKMFPKSDYQEP